MNPDLEALTDAIAQTSGCLRFAAEAEATPILETLSDLGFHLVADVSLPNSAPRGDRAAEKIDDLSERQWAVWFVISHFGPLTDEEADARYQAGVFGSEGNVLPPQTPQSIRSRRKELERAGHVAATGEKRQTKAGGWGQVWVTAESGRGVEAA